MKIRHVLIALLLSIGQAVAQQAPTPPIFTGSGPGLVPASAVTGSPATNYLDTTGHFSVPPSSSGGSILINGVTCNVGGSCTITAAATLIINSSLITGSTANYLLYGDGTKLQQEPVSSLSIAFSQLTGLNALTFGTHLASGGTSYNGSGAVTITSDAASANTASTIVARDSSGNFSAGTITASLTGGASLDLPLTGGTLTGMLAINGNAVALPTPLTGALLQIGNLDATSTRIELDNFGATSFFTSAGYGGTNASRTAVGAATQIGGYNALAYNGTSLAGPIASLRSFTNATFAAGANGGGYVDIAATPVGSTTLTSLIQFFPAGIITPGVTGGSEGANSINAGALYQAGAQVLTLAGGTMTGTLNMGAQVLTNLTTPSNPSDAATKSYVDASVVGLQIKPTATLATTAALPSNIYNNGASGVGATLTMVATGVVTVDGQAIALGNLVLVKNEVTAANNGLYTVTTAGALGVAAILTRQVDMNQASEFSGAFIPVGNAGTLNANSLWLANPSGTVTVGTTAIPFTQLNGATDLIATAPLNISGNTIALTGIVPASTGGTGVNNGSNTLTLGNALTVAALTTAGDAAYVSSSGNVGQAALVGGYGVTWGTNETVTAETIPVDLPNWSGGGTITSVSYYTGGSGSPSFVADVTIGGTGVTGCNAITVSSSTPATASCSGGTFTSSSSIQLVISSVSGTPNVALIKINTTHTVN